VVHVVYRFDTGGLENGIVNLINRMPAVVFRHAVVALTEVSDEFRKRIGRTDIGFHALHKPPGQGLWMYPQLYKLFRHLRPAVVHSRNLAALEAQLPAWLAGVPVRIHGEHGRDISDLQGRSRRHQWMRRVYRPFVHHYVALSRDLAEYLQCRIGVPGERIVQPCNGVDLQRFRPAEGGRAPLAGNPFDDPALWLVGTVGRMHAVKHQTLLAQAFVQALQTRPHLRKTLRLVMVGDGPLREESMSLLEAAGLGHLAWLPGERSDVANVMRALNCFVLPSLAEGISNTILEAMATGLPVIATAVGGNADLVAQGVSGEIVPVERVEPMTQALLRMAEDPARATAMGREGRTLAERRFSLTCMVAAYQGLYQQQLAARGVTNTEHS
jgi:sugar transferase (PEP-CTERM/EpsH1 system associated)